MFDVMIMTEVRAAMTFVGQVLADNGYDVQHATETLVKEAFKHPDCKDNVSNNQQIKPKAIREEQSGRAMHLHDRQDA